MAASIRALVKPALLRWARESIGLSEVAAARKMNLSDDRVSLWEAGEAQPTIVQLRRAAEVYNRALGVFFLSEPPTEFDTLRDFRRLADSQVAEWSSDLHIEYRRAQQQRQFALDLFELEETMPPADWRAINAGNQAADQDIAEAARSMLTSLAPLPMPRPSGTMYDHLNYWVSAIEQSGILVLNTRRGQVSTTEMRAFSLYFEALPVVMLNGADAPRGRLFSLLHEFVHLTFRTGGVCDLTADIDASTPNRRIEARCNAIAAAILMPEEAVLARPELLIHGRGSDDWTYESLAEAAAPFGVSAEAFLRRLLTLGLVDQTFYELRRSEFQAAYEEETTRSNTGGDWYRNTVRDLGKGYVRQIADAHRRRVIDSYTAASYLNVKVGQIDRLAATAAIATAV